MAGTTKVVTIIVVTSQEGIIVLSIQTKSVVYVVDDCNVIVFGRKMKIKALQVPVVGTAPIIGAALSAGHDCGCVPEEK